MEYTDYLDNGGIREDSDGEPIMSDGELLDLIIEVTEQEPNAEGLPTDRGILMAINDACTVTLMKWSFSITPNLAKNLIAMIINLCTSNT